MENDSRVQNPTLLPKCNHKTSTTTKKCGLKNCKEKHSFFIKVECIWIFIISFRCTKGEQRWNRSKIRHRTQNQRGCVPRVTGRPSQPPDSWYGLLLTSSSPLLNPNVESHALQLLGFCLCRLILSQSFEFESWILHKWTVALFKFLILQIKNVSASWNISSQGWSIICSSPIIL